MMMRFIHHHHQEKKGPLITLITHSLICDHDNSATMMMTMIMPLFSPIQQQQQQQQQKQWLMLLLIMMTTQFMPLISHPQYRQLKCATPDGQLRAGPDPAKCHIVIKDTEVESPGRPAAEGDGCFWEVLDNGDDERVYCDLVCPKAHTVFISSIDQGHRACFNYYTYQLEKRDEDWFLWRSGKCLNSTISFTVGCKFDEPFRTQFPSDSDVFARLRARARKAL